jgi:ElaA protein
LSSGLGALVQWQFLPFDVLTGAQMYAVMQLRSEVFVVEQNCIFQDMDGKDAQAMHLLGLQQINGTEVLVAYARCFDRGVSFVEASIGRVVTSHRARGHGLGHQLMREAVAALTRTWGEQPIRIGAQAHLNGFYAQHDFVDMQLPYLEDGIPHLEMLRTL